MDEIQHDITRFEIFSLSFSQIIPRSEQMGVLEVLLAADVKGLDYWFFQDVDFCIRGSVLEGLIRG
jgi:hypothetical protein